MSSPCTVTATLDNVGDGALTSAAFVRFKLRNFSGFIPRIIGTAVVAETQIDAFPNGSGQISQQIWGNDNLDPANTFYTVEYWSLGRITSSANYSITGATVDLDSAPQINPPNPPSSAATNILLQTNSVNNGNQFKLNLHSSDGSIVLTDDGLGDVNLQGGVSGASFFSIKPRGIIKNFNSTAVTSQGTFGVGATSYSTGGTSAQQAPSYPEPATLNISTGSASSLSAFGIQSTFSNPANFIFGLFRRYQCRISLGNNTNIRSWVGVGNAPNSLPSTAWAADAPAFALAAFRFSKNAGDTTWKCVTQDSTGGAGNQNIIDSLVTPVVGTSQIFQITYDGSSTVTFYINGAQVAQTTAHVPPTSTPYLEAVTVDNQNSANNVSINWAHLFVYESL